MTRAPTTTDNQVARRGSTRLPPTKPITEATKRAVIYLRVSTAQQAATDHDGEGFSIPAQRDACLRKAESLDAVVLDEYLDAGESARSADRPALQTMLERLAKLRDVDYVIVHKVDRLARNRLDDATINLAISQAGARLVSVTENIDGSPSGLLLHGIMSSIAEFYSANLATEIKKGMNQKAKKGGKPGMAPVGYLNVRDLSDGKEVRTIAIDPERAPLIQWAFEGYASGDYTLRQLTEELSARGLTSNPMGTKRSAKALAMSQVAKLLHNSFYIGIVTWDGVQYEGRHEPLISIELFAKVQAVLASREKTEEKQRKHPHYLKSTIFCGRCQSRLCFSHSRGKLGGYYDYFFCLGRNQHRTECDLPYLRVEEIEDAVAACYSEVQLGPDMIEQIRTKLITALRKTGKSAELEARRQRARITQLEAERRKLLQAHLSGAIALDLLKEEQDRIMAELANAGGRLASTEIHWETVETNVELALALMGDCQRLYREAGPETRRQLNQVFFEALLVDVDGVTYRRMAEPFGQFVAHDEFFAQLEREMKSRNPAPDSQGRGSKAITLVEVVGLEPTTSTLRT